MEKEIERDAKGQITGDAIISPYQPTKEEIDLTRLVMKDYIHGNNIINRTRREFNDRSVIIETDLNQKAFNSYVEPRSEDPDESWRAQTVRPLTRNKIISIAAHVTATILYPAVFAFNDESEEDRDAGYVARTLIEWVIENSNYKREFLNAVIAALVDPAVIVQVEYSETMRTVRYMQASGQYTTKEILDEVLSGFHMYIVQVKQMLISNYYESNIQRQRFLIRNRYIDYNDAKAVWGSNNNFQYVKPGVRAIFDSMTQTFYDQRDKDLMEYMVNEVTYYNRAMDLEVVFCNGILVTDTQRPNPRNDKLYPFAKSGYEVLNNGNCFYYKSAVNKLGSDQDIVDTLYNMVLDGTFISLMPPVAIYGSEEINSSVFIPGASVSFKDPNSKMESFAPKIDLRAGLESIQKVEASMAESAQDMLSSENLGDRTTARQFLGMEQQAQIAMGLFGKMVAQLVEDIGHLMMGDIIQHMTVGDVEELTGQLKYKSFVLPDKIVDGKKMPHRIEFMNPAELPETFTQGDVDKRSFDIFEREGGMENSKLKIYQVNPSLWRELKYRVKCSPDELMPVSKALEKALNLELYDRAIQNPIADQEEVTRDFLFASYRPGDPDKYIDQDKVKATKQAAQGQQGGQFQQNGVNTNLVSQLTGGNSLGVAASSAMR